MSGHTEGPWGHVAAGSNHWIYGPGKRVVAYIGGKDNIFTAHKNTPHDANARLIAAAPAMYGRLELTAGVIEELYREGAFRRLETGSDREREALALLLRIVETHHATIAAAEGRGKDGNSHKVIS